MSRARRCASPGIPACSSALLPEFEPAIGYEQRTAHHDLTVDEHIFHAVQLAADDERPLRVRLAVLLHDLGKPPMGWRGDDGYLHFYAKPGQSDRGHAEVGAEIADAVLRRLRYPNDLRTRVVQIVRHPHVRAWGGPTRCERAPCWRASATA